MDELRYILRKLYLICEVVRPWIKRKVSYINDTWRALQVHQMETFSALLVLCAGNSPVIGEFPAQRTSNAKFDVFFDLRLNRRLSKQLRGWRFETPSGSLWRHRNALIGSSTVVEVLFGGKDEINRAPALLDKLASASNLLTEYLMSLYPHRTQLKRWDYNLGCTDFKCLILHVDHCPE